MKLIGIVGRAYYNKDNQKIIQVNEDIRKVFSKYDDVVTTLILPTNDSYYVDVKMGEDKITDRDKRKLDYLLEKCDGFIVPGGTYWYNLDEYVIKYAIDNNKPLLAICLGFQALCSMYARNRYKFDMTDKLGSDNHYGDCYSYIHYVNILDNTKLKDILGKKRISVDSVHHDYINTEFNYLVPNAMSSDGILEGVEVVDRDFIMGVEWHPEYIVDDNSCLLFDSFVNSINKKL